MINHTSTPHFSLNHPLAIFLSAGANFILGASSLYWKTLDNIHPVTLVAYRIILSTAILAIGLSIFRRKSQIGLITLRIISLNCIASLLIAVNWATFITASINGYFLESGFGYLLAPFISISLGVLIYREPINTKNTASAVVAFCLIAALIIFAEKLNHWTYLLIASTWDVYTYIKKLTPLNAINGLFIETLFLTICLVLATALFKFSIVWPNEMLVRSNPLIWLAGFVSLAPLLMFSYSTGKLPLFLTGILQFILPLTLLSISFTFYRSKASDISQALVITSTTIIITLLAYNLIKTHAASKKSNDE